VRAPLTRAEKRAAVLLLLLCLLPVGVARFIERRQENRPAPIRVSAQTLAKYTGVVPLGGSGYVRIGDQGFEGGPPQAERLREGEWDIFVDDAHQDIEAHPDTPQGWKVEFVEELPDWETSGAGTIGVRVTIPRRARQAVADGARAGLFHTRDGVQHYFAESFGVAPNKTHGQAINSRAGRAGFGDERANASAPGRFGPDRRGEGHNARNRRGVVHRSGDH